MVKRVLLFGGIVTLFSGLFSFPTHADIESATASSTFSIDVSDIVLQVTASPTATIVLEPISPSAVFGSTNVTVNVATNNATGYKFTMDLSSTDLAHTTITGQDAPVIPTLSAATTQGNFPANAWGYKPVGDNYLPVGTTNTSSVWETDSPTNGTNHTIALGASVDGTKESGDYTNTLVFNVVANSLIPHDNVTFNGNGADSGNMSGDGFSVTTGESTLLPSNKYTKANYRFIGWNTNVNGTGLSYVDEGEYNAVSTNYNQNITLYAMWSNLPEGSSTPGTTPGGNPGVTISRAYEIAYVAAGKGMWEKNENDNEYTQIADGIYHNRDVRWDMQGMTPEICGSVTVIEDSYQAIDIRDFRKYNIVKLKDGRCWMQDNLALDPTDQATAGRMSSSTTNATGAAVYNYLHGGNPDSEPGWTSQQVQNIPVGSQFAEFVQPQIDKSQIETISSDSLDQDGSWKVGVYYNYCAVSIGTYCYTRGTYQLDRQGTDIDTIYDVCPLGWRLPTSGYETDGYEFQNVLLSYYDAQHGTGSFDDYRNALHLPFSGEHGYWGNIDYLGTSSRFWSATYIYRGNDPNSEMSAATINKNGYSAGWRSYSNRMLSGSVRCINKQ